MEVKRLFFESQKVRPPITFKGSEIGIWGEQNYFVPIESIRIYVFHKENVDRQWIAFSEIYEWIYISTEKDDFIEFLLRTLPFHERFEMTSGKNQERDSIYLEGGALYMFYSYRKFFIWDIENKELPLGEVKHSRRFYSWADNVGMRALSTEEYTLTAKEEDLLQSHSNDLFTFGFHHQSSARFFLTSKVDSGQHFYLVQYLEKTHFFSSQYYDQAVDLSRLTLIELVGEERSFNILTLPGLDALVFKDAQVFADYLKQNGIQNYRKMILSEDVKETQTGKKTWYFKLANDEFLLINESLDENYTEGQMFLEGHLQKIFYWSDEHKKPSVIELLDQTLKEVWKGNWDDVHAPKVLKDFVIEKNKLQKRQSLEGNLGCIGISLVVLLVISLLIYWIFW